MATWEERMAAKAAARRSPERDWRVENAAAFPRELAEQAVVDYCGDEGPPYCSEVRPDGDSGRWLAFLTCTEYSEFGPGGVCRYGHRHHDREVWVG